MTRTASAMNVKERATWRTCSLLGTGLRDRAGNVTENFTGGLVALEGGAGGIQLAGAAEEGSGSSQQWADAVFVTFFSKRFCFLFYDLVLQSNSEFVFPSLMMLYVIYLFIPFKLPREDPYLRQTRGSVCVCVCVCVLSQSIWCRSRRGGR